MKKVLAVVAVLAIASTTFAVGYTNAPYAGSYTKGWTFDTAASTAAQGWLTRGTGAWASNYGGTMTSADTGGAVWNTAGTRYAAWNTGSGAGKNAFVIKCDILIPYRADLAANGYAHPGVLQGQGIGMVRPTTDIGPAVGGRNSNAPGTGVGATAMDRSWDNTNRNLSWCYQVRGSNNTISDTWMSLMLDYGVSIPGRWNAYTYVPVQSGYTADTGWLQITPAGGLEVNPGDSFTRITINGLYGAINKGGTAWGNAFVDNVAIYVAPEPASLALLALGFVGLIRRR